MSTLSTILAAVLGVAFFAAGIPKLAGRAGMVANFERWGYPDVIRVTTGTLEVLGAALLLIGIVVTPLVITGTLLVIVVMIGALLTHARASDPIAKRFPAAVLLLLAIVLAVSLWP